MFAQGFAAAEMLCIPENIFEDGEWAILEWRDPKGLRGCGFFHVRDDRIVYRDDLLRLLFMCCHPELPATQQIALALRIVCGLTVPEIARAFLVTDVAMEQRITRAKKLVAAERIPFETP